MDYILNDIKDFFYFPMFVIVVMCENIFIPRSHMLHYIEKCHVCSFLSSGSAKTICKEKENEQFMAKW